MPKIHPLGANSRRSAAGQVRAVAGGIERGPDRAPGQQFGQHAALGQAGPEHHVEGNAVARKAAQKIRDRRVGRTSSTSSTVCAPRPRRRPTW